MRNLLIATGLCLLSVSCCHDNSCPDNPVQTPGYSSDNEITTKIKAYTLSHASGVTVTTSNGMVTLGGTVSSLADKNKIICYAQSVQGVRRVVDNMTITGN